MPRVSRYKTAALGDLARQLAFAPPATRQRQMDAAEQLVADLDPQLNYPNDFIIYRITGYRADRPEEPVTLVGDAVLPDLVTFVQELSAKLELDPHRDGRPALTLDDVAQRLSVSLKTIQRYRRLGLVCHYVVNDTGDRKLMCYQDSLDRFVGTHQPQVRRAASFSRMDAATELAIIDQARRLHLNENLTLNDVAQRLAREHGRAHETVRQMLRRHDRGSSTPIFSERGPLSDRDTQAIYRAWRRAVEPAVMAKRFGRSSATIHRAICHGRRIVLDRFSLNYIKIPTFDLPDAGEVILHAEAVTSGLALESSEFDAVDLIQNCRQAASPDESQEHALVAAFNFLKKRCAERLAMISDAPGSEVLDRIETDLRWGGLLKRQLLMMALPAAITHSEQNLHRTLVDQPTEAIVSGLRLAVDVICEVVDTLNPSRGQRLQRVTGHAMERALARKDHREVAQRAAVRHARGSVPLGHMFEQVCPWDAWLALPATFRAHIPLLDDLEKPAMMSRYGLTGEPPRTVNEIAQSMSLTPIQMVRLLCNAHRTLRAHVRREIA